VHRSSVIFMPRRILHHFSNVGDRLARMLSWRGVSAFAGWPLPLALSRGHRPRLSLSTSPTATTSRMEPTMMAMAVVPITYALSATAQKPSRAPRVCEGPRGASKERGSHSESCAASASTRRLFVGLPLARQSPQPHGFEGLMLGAEEGPPFPRFRRMRCASAGGPHRACCSRSYSPWRCPF
jgi:hypothetical protein